MATGCSCARLSGCSTHFCQTNTWRAVNFFFFQAEDGIRDKLVTGVQTCALPISRGGLSGWNDPVVIVSLGAAVVLLPLFVVIEGRTKAPMLDLSIFRNRMFAAATAAAFINGLSDRKSVV